MNTAKENELYQFHVYRKIQCSISSFMPQYPTAKPKNYQQNVTVGEGFLTVLGKTFEMDQSRLIDVSSMTCLENERSG